MKNNDIIVVNDLQEIEKEEYDSLISRYIDLVSENPVVESVYTFGSINDPGLSDIDLIVVTNDSIDPLNVKRLSVPNTLPANKSRNAFIHDIYLINASIVEDLQYVLYCGNLQYLYGKKQKIKDISKRHMEPISIQILFDFTVSRLMQFKQFVSMGKITRRGAAVRISSIKHSYNLLKNLGITDRPLESFVEETQDLRKNIKTIDNEDIKKIFFDSVRHFFRIVKLASEHFEQNYLTFHSVVDKSNSLKISPEYNLFFDKIKPGQDHNTDAQNTITYPEEVFYHYFNYLELGNMLSDVTGNYLAYTGGEKYDLSEEYTEVQKIRLDGISRQYKYVKANRAYYSMIGFPGYLVNWESVI